MRRVKSQNLAQLLMQLRFTPEKKRRKQLEAAEKLFGIIDKDKEYPFEFVHFGITGFHIKGEVNAELIKGGDLLDDLWIFISKLSSQLALPASEQKEKVYTIEELAAQLNVSTKTINRWRKQGLIARKFVFHDGGKHLGFLQSTVEKFVNTNQHLVSGARDFKRLTNKQKQQIIKQAKELATKTGLSRYQIISQIASKTGTAHETIRYTLLRYEKSRPDGPIFKKPSFLIDAAKAGEIYKLYKQKVKVPELMKRFNRSKSSIYRIINLRRAIALQARKIEFIISDEFLADDATKRILAEPIDLEHSVTSKIIEPFELVGEHLVPEYLQILKDAPILNREREVELFRRYNYLKYLAWKTRSGIKLSRVSSRLLEEIEGYLAQAEEIRRIIIEANLRLVVSTASKHAATGASFSELVSKGNYALIQAVEQFDYTKGLRFSKRASLNIAKEYAKVSGKDTELSRKKAASLASIQRDLRTAAAADIGTVERARKSLTNVIKEELNQREQYIILNHFGLVGTGVKRQRKTLNQIGDYLGLSKERIRQIELIALQKLRQCLSSEEFELLTG